VCAFSAAAISDTLPVSHGHTLILPKRHIASFFETDENERAGLLDLLIRMQLILSENYQPDGFNIGINDGAAAGQTMGHLHIHLIPRYKGDMPDPHGGIRLIFPDNAVYWG
jgi:diadenosine tetraphosphate (Ap4A) HIT family hydrolase